MVRRLFWRYTDSVIPDSSTESQPSEAPARQHVLSLPLLLQSDDSLFEVEQPIEPSSVELQATQRQVANLQDRVNELEQLVADLVERVGKK